MNNNNVPMYVSFGFDDNSIAKSLNWASELLKKYGSCTFLLSSKFITEEGVREEWLNLVTSGHEMGNHTHSHDFGVNFSESKWQNEIEKCENILTAPYPEGIGLDRNKLYGFRAPYLDYNPSTFKVLKQNGYLYDCSTQDGWNTKFDGSNYKWPSQDNGLWILPCYPFIIPPDNMCERYGVKPGFRKSKVEINQEFESYNVDDGKITGLDYNLLVSFQMNKQEFLATLKYTFDQRYYGNRCPMLIGAHSDFYDDSFTMAKNITPKEMREVLEEFLEYVSSFSYVQISSYKKVIDYLKEELQ